MSGKCKLGWHDYNTCCCNCKHQVLIMDDESTNAVGYGCAALMEDEKLVFWGDFAHGLCEFHVREQD